MTAGRRAALLGTLVVLLPALALVAKLPSQPLILSVLNDAAHAPVFGALAITLLLLLERITAWTPRRSYLAAFVLAIAIGGLIELIQPVFGRGAELKDLLNDALGAAAGLAVMATIRSRKRWPLLIAVIALTPVAWPIAVASIAYAARARQFPTLFEDYSREDRYFIRTRGVEIAVARLPRPWARAGDPPSLRIRIVGRRWPGVTYLEPQPDWSGHSRLMFDLTNPDSRPLTLTLRVHDRAHDKRSEDRFNRTFTIPAGRRSVLAFPLAEIAAAPQDRDMDLARIAGLIVFSAGAADQLGHEYYLTRIWLE